MSFFFCQNIQEKAVSLRMTRWDLMRRLVTVLKALVPLSLCPSLIISSRVLARFCFLPRFVCLCLAFNQFKHIMNHDLLPM